MQDDRLLKAGKAALTGIRRRKAVLDCLRTVQKIRRGDVVISGYSRTLQPYINMSDDELARAITMLEYETALVDHALSCLPHELRGPCLDLYVNKVRWLSTCEKWHICESGLYRRLNRAAREIGRVLSPIAGTAEELLAELYEEEQ